MKRSINLANGIEIAEGEVIVQSRVCEICDETFRHNNSGDRVCRCFLEANKNNWHVANVTGDRLEYIYKSGHPLVTKTIIEQWLTVSVNRRNGNCGLL